LVTLEEWSMKTAMYYGAAALLLMSAPAVAQQTGKTLDPNHITEQVKRPPLKLDDQQRATIANALVTENTEQKTPPKFEPKVGDAIPGTMTVDVMPPDLIKQQPSLQPYGYAKLAKDVLVIDPMKKTIVAVLPRVSPTTGKDVAPADWAKTKGRELTGQQPEPASSTAPGHEPAGDSGDKSNGNEADSKKQ
jgi:hypothetical protein